MLDALRSARVFLALALACCGSHAAAGEAPKLKVLFLGDKGHHQPVERFRLLQPVMAARGIDVQYADGAAALNPETLGKYDALLVYANIDAITPEQEKAL